MRPQGRSTRRQTLLLLGALLLSAVLLAEAGSGSSKSKDKKGKDKKKGSKKPATLEVTIPEGARAGDRLDFVTPSASRHHPLRCRCHAMLLGRSPAAPRI